MMPWVEQAVDSSVATATQGFAFIRVPGIERDPALKGRAKVIGSIRNPACIQVVWIPRQVPGPADGKMDFGRNWCRAEGMRALQARSSIAQAGGRAASGSLGYSAPRLQRGPALAALTCRGWNAARLRRLHIRHSMAE